MLTPSCCIVVLITPKTSGSMSSSASKIVTISFEGPRQADVSPCGLLIGASENVATLTLDRCSDSIARRASAMVP